MSFAPASCRTGWRPNVVPNSAGAGSGREDPPSPVPLPRSAVHGGSGGTAWAPSTEAAPACRFRESPRSWRLRWRGDGRRRPRRRPWAQNVGQVPLSKKHRLDLTGAGGKEHHQTGVEGQAPALGLSRNPGEIFSAKLYEPRHIGRLHGSTSPLKSVEISIDRIGGQHTTPPAAGRASLSESASSMQSTAGEVQRERRGAGRPRSEA